MTKIRTYDKQKRRKQMTFSRYIRMSVTVFTLLFLIIGGMLAYIGFQLNNVTSNTQQELDRGDRSSIREGMVSPTKDNISILFLGVDDRSGDLSGRTDANILATFNEEEGSVKMISIPRDSLVNIPGRGNDKINHAHAFGGIDMTIDTVEELLNIPVDYFVTINFDAFMEIVDTLGGVDVDVPFTFSEMDSLDDANAITLEEGEQTLNGEEALAKINQQKFDLVISDVMMPNMSGYELTLKIRETKSLSELPILLLTARGRPEELETGFHSGANDYVVKPIEPLELRARVRMLTELREAVTDQMRMEAAWLRAQIKPHFLFNAINSILVLMEKDQEKMEDLLEKFIYYLQTSFDFQNIDHVVPLEQELELVDAYLSIEQVRFEGRVKINWEVSESSKFIQVPPLSIQTLVENAVRHGILNKAEGGTVTIKVIDQKDTYKIEITDDGVGMPNELKEGIFQQKGSRKYGIGLLNTDKRLRQYYGNGLHISSKLHEGTTISFELPKSIDL